MRGDMQPRLHHGGLQNDSSSGSSSPHSNTSHEDTLEVSGPEILPKAIYNFSIPDVIKHEPRFDRDISRNQPHRELHSRKRNRSLNAHQDPQHRTDIVETPVIVQSKKRRKARAAAVAAAVADLDDRDNDDDNCHRQSVPVIDLTGVDSHDEYANVDSDLNTSRDDSTPFQSSHSNSFHDVLSDLERYQQRLHGRERHVDRLCYRSPSVQRLHRLQRRRNEAFRSRQIITDGPVVTEDMLLHNTLEPGDPSIPERTSPDDALLVANETGNRADEDHAIALRMQSDPTYSPPYYSPQNFGSTYSRRHASRFHHIHERFRALRQRREFESTQEHMAEIRNMTQLLTRDTAQEAAAAERDTRTRDNNLETTNTTENQRENPENRREGPSYNNSDEIGENDDGDVEFIGEWNTANHMQPQHPVLGPLPFTLQRNSIFSQINRRNFPDFQSHSLLTYLPTTPPRLHHLYHENYEALLNLAERIGPAKPRGLEKSDIERIPSFRFSSSTAKETNAKCVVCISEYNNREKLRRLPCSHDFHAKCIDKWLKSNKTCPVCRDEVKATSTE